MVLWWKKKKSEEPSEEKPVTPAQAPAVEKPAEYLTAPAERPGAGARKKKGAPEPAAPTEPEQRSGFFTRLVAGIARSRASFTGQIRSLFTQSPQLDDEFFENLEAILLAADCGVEITSEVIQLVKERSKSEATLGPDQGLALIKSHILQKVQGNQSPMNLQNEPYSVILIVGVNGVGKTTTIAKLAHIFQAYGKKILLVAGDTFRAGAIEQLKVWGTRLGIDVHAGSPGADPSSVIFDAMSAAKARGYDLVICDTAGRLHTQVNLMEEIRKVRRVIQKVVPEAPHETFLVLDSTTGQNAISQANLFNESLSLSGLVLTKLDGTAKGGIVVAISQKLRIPIRFVGVGESLEDLDAFRPEEFVEALFQ